MMIIHLSSVFVSISCSQGVLCVGTVLHIGICVQQIAPRSYYEQRALFSEKASLFSFFCEQEIQWVLLEFAYCLDNGTSN